MRKSQNVDTGQHSTPKNYGKKCHSKQFSAFLHVIPPQTLKLLESKRRICKAKRLAKGHTPSFPTLVTSFSPRVKRNMSGREETKLEMRWAFRLRIHF